jgi:hypothetical protein
MTLGEIAMKTIETTQVAGADNLLHVTIPVDEANRAYRMVIVLVPEAANSNDNVKTGWPAGYWESVYGSIQDETLIRLPQGE